MTSDPKVVWQKDDARIVVWYEPRMVCDMVVQVRHHVVERTDTKNALGEPNWRKVEIPRGFYEIINDFIDKLGFVIEKQSDNE